MVWFSAGGRRCPHVPGRTSPAVGLCKHAVRRRCGLQVGMRACGEPRGSGVGGWEFGRSQPGAPATLCLLLEGCVNLLIETVPRR